jgi:hypothetical protein
MLDSTALLLPEPTETGNHFSFQKLWKGLENQRENNTFELIRSIDVIISRKPDCTYLSSSYNVFDLDAQYIINVTLSSPCQLHCKFLIE